MYELSNELINHCDICGAPDAMIRTITRENRIIDELSGFTCEGCMSDNTEHDFVADLSDKLETNTRLRTVLAERFRMIRMKEKGLFISSYGTGIEHEKCEICEQSYSYLCVVEDHKDNGDIKVLDEVSGWFCADCITMGREKTCLEDRVRDLVVFNIVCDNSQLSAGRYKDIADQALDYARRTVRMGKARELYTGVPVKTLIMSAIKGQKCCSCCGDIENMPFEEQIERKFFGET